MASTFNKEGFNIVDHYVYVICGDGCLQVFSVIFEISVLYALFFLHPN
jgi:transketolase